ncbi:helix-turn-helix transcriptional regulator [Virgibacillus phasianinus]|uniref:Helix-turn-helix transcriptional regulator n=1 Tax=Virgibacillus phasianinus TaxID=2017483 RepID=A0A220U432_9BACI|nr:response regulator transcription factor [Virgibacillus phasianinus]ASK62676.1 helix-turn-helix transcriptional regulator [Virgibacillus phasianinus]
MSLTLNRQMHLMFCNGLELVKLYKQPILNEWDRILVQLQKAEKKSGRSTKMTIDFFSEHLFNLTINESMEVSLKGKIPDSLQTNQFVINLLENAVHKVIQSKKLQSHQDYQAIQYLFSMLSEYILTQPNYEQFTIGSFLKNLVSSNQLPIEWAAILTKRNDKFFVEQWFNNLSQSLFLENDEKTADSIYNLSELLLGEMPKEKQENYTVLPIPYENGTLLICTLRENASHSIPFITYALQVFQNGKESLIATKEEQQWKDSVIMFNENIMRSQTFNEACENITEGFVNYLPFERCALFSYSMNDQIGVGLFGHRLNNKAIQSITEEIGNLPVIQDSLQILQVFAQNMNYLQPVYVKDASLGFPEQYIKQFELQSVVIAPIFTSAHKLLGAAILDQGAGKEFKISQDTFSALIKFGQSAGEILQKYHIENPKQSKTEAIHFSPREIEVLKLMAEGASTSEAANSLNLSEYTVRDYISAIMQKMEAKNRTEAVARAIRDGQI